ncbi:hypothetical protein BJ166DRAFT_490702 [Pestalotiopsis sp. NC0098]|nr:hypothetical protein BJ166DRAFT_490702 [Pestalotiopsis sp. NC0098]
MATNYLDLACDPKDPLCGGECETVAKATVKKDKSRRLGLYKTGQSTDGPLSDADENKFRLFVQANVHAMYATRLVWTYEPVMGVVNEKSVDSDESTRTAGVVLDFGPREGNELVLDLDKEEDWKEYLQPIQEEVANEARTLLRQLRSDLQPTKAFWVSEYNDGKGNGTERTKSLEHRINLDFDRGTGLFNGGYDICDFIKERIPILVEWRKDEWDSESAKDQGSIDLLQPLT